MQAGLRVEDTRIDGLQQTTGGRNGQHYSRAYPTLHLSYRLDDQRKLTASYSERVQRPPPIYLFPLKVYRDPNNYQQGNPDLAPQQTRSFELGYERRRGPTLFTVNAYYRDNKDEFTPIERDEGDGVFNTTIDNLGSSRAAGLELSANGALSKALTYNANADVYWKRINAANIGFAGPRSAYGVNGRLNLNWQARAKDLLQLNLSAQGKRLIAQAVVQPNWTLNAGWRHRITDKVTATLSAQDLLDTNRNRQNFDTPALMERYRGRYLSRAVLLRLDYRFGGGKPAADPGFDYSSGAGP